MISAAVPYQSRWRHRRWIDVAVAAAFPLTPLFLAVWALSGAPSLGVALADLPKIMALSGVFGASVPAAWWWARVVPALGRVVDPEFRREMRLTPTPPAEIVAVEVTSRAWWASGVVPAHIVVVCAGAAWEAFRNTTEDIGWTMVMVSTLFCLFLVVAFRATQALAWSLAVLHSRLRGGGWLTWSWIQFVVGLAVANAIIFGVGPSCFVLLETTMEWLNGMPGRPVPADIVLTLVTLMIGGAYSAVALYGLGAWVERSRRAIVESLGQLDEGEEAPSVAVASPVATASPTPSTLACWALGMGMPALLVAASMGVWTSAGAAPVVLLAGLMVAAATLRWALAATAATATIPGASIPRPAAALCRLGWAAVGPAVGVVITTSTVTLWLVQPDSFGWIDLDPIRHLNGLAGLLAATFAAVVLLIASGEVFLRRRVPVPAGAAHWTLHGAVLVLVSWTLQGMVLLPMVFAGNSLQNKARIADTPGVLASSLLVLAVLVLLWLYALRGWWDWRTKVGRRR